MIIREINRHKDIMMAKQDDKVLKKKNTRAKQR